MWLPDNHDGLQNLCPQIHSAQTQDPSPDGCIMTARLGQVILWFYRDPTCCILWLIRGHQSLVTVSVNHSWFIERRLMRLLKGLSGKKIICHTKQVTRDLFFPPHKHIMCLCACVLLSSDFSVAQFHTIYISFVLRASLPHKPPTFSQ